jgi:hypothetical protein
MAVLSVKADKIDVCDCIDFLSMISRWLSQCDRRFWVRRLQARAATKDPIAALLLWPVGRRPWMMYVAGTNHAT